MRYRAHEHRAERQPRRINDFIDWLESLADGSETAELWERIGKVDLRGRLSPDFAAYVEATTPEAFNGDPD